MRVVPRSRTGDHHLRQAEADAATAINGFTLCRTTMRRPSRLHPGRRGVMRGPARMLIVLFWRSPPRRRSRRRIVSCRPSPGYVVANVKAALPDEQLRELIALARGHFASRERGTGRSLYRSRAALARAHVHGAGGSGTGGGGHDQLHQRHAAAVCADLAISPRILGGGGRAGPGVGPRPAMRPPGCSGPPYAWCAAISPARAPNTRRLLSGCRRRRQAVALACSPRCRPAPTGWLRRSLCSRPSGTPAPDGATRAY